MMIMTLKSVGSCDGSDQKQLRESSGRVHWSVTWQQPNINDDDDDDGDGDQDGDDDDDDGDQDDENIHLMFGQWL